MSGGRVEEDEERTRQRKLEEALEIKSLRRIVSAYLKYVFFFFFSCLSYTGLSIQRSSFFCLKHICIHAHTYMSVSRSVLGVALNYVISEVLSMY